MGHLFFCEAKYKKYYNNSIDKFLKNILNEKHRHIWLNIYNLLIKLNGDARGVIVIVVGNGYDNTSTNPGRDWLHFT